MDIWIELLGCFSVCGFVMKVLYQLQDDNVLLWLENVKEFVVLFQYKIEKGFFLEVFLKYIFV